MRNHHACPKCEGTELWVIEPFRHAGSHANVAQPLHVGVHVLGKNDRDPGTRAEIGQYQAWVCNACGYTEFYAYGFGDLATLAQQPGSGVRFVQGPPQTHGYR